MNDNLPNGPKDTSGRTILRIFIAVGLLVGTPLGMVTLAQQPDTQQTQSYKARPSLKSPIKIQQIPQTMTFQLYGQWVSGIAGIKLYLTSVVDNVEIQSVTVNRGNCTVFPALETIDYNDTIEHRESDGWRTEYSSNNMTYYKSNGDYAEKRWKKSGATLKFGGTTEVKASCSEILEVAVKTDLGEFKFGSSE
jgi:hypothetical protein